MSVSPSSVAVGPDGSVYFATFSRILGVSARFPGIGAGELTVGSPDGSEVWIFDAAGRHLRTVDAFTGSTLAEIGTDSHGRLVTVSDLDGNVTTIERDASGNPTGIVGPFGQRTALGLDSDGFLASVTSPGTETHLFTYHPPIWRDTSGLLASMRDPRGGQYTFTYDGIGQLLTDTDPSGGGWTLARFDEPEGLDRTYVVVMTSAEGRERGIIAEHSYPGLERRTFVGFDGLRNVLEIRATGEVRSEAPDDTVSTTLDRGDPRFGLAAPYVQQSTTRSPRA